MSTASSWIRRAVAAVATYGAVLESPADILRYGRMRAARAIGLKSAAPAVLHVRTIGGAPVLCRASRDVWTFKHTFLVGFHRPPIAIPAYGTIVDLGSNVGYTVADLAFANPTARVVGVEMDRNNFDLAMRNVAIFGDRVQLLHAAVWTEDGEISYSGVEDDAFAVTGAAVADEREGTGRSSAPARRLTSILDAFGLERVDYLKMDIEGAEAAILSAPLDWAERVQSMKIELHPPATFASASAALESVGFACRRDPSHPDCVVAVRR